MKLPDDLQREIDALPDDRKEIFEQVAARIKQGIIISRLQVPEIFPPERDVLRQTPEQRAIIMLLGDQATADGRTVRLEEFQK